MARGWAGGSGPPVSAQARSPPLSLRFTLFEDSLFAIFRRIERTAASRKPLAVKRHSRKNFHQMAPCGQRPRGPVLAGSLLAPQVNTWRGWRGCYSPAFSSQPSDSLVSNLWCPLSSTPVSFSLGQNRVDHGVWVTPCNQ